MKDHPLPPDEAARLYREKRTLMSTLTGLGLTAFKVGVTGHHGGGRPHAWASVPVDDAAHLYTALTNAGFDVRVGVHTVSVLIGEAA